MNLDSRPRQDELDSVPLEHSVPDHAPSGGAVLFEKLTVSDPLEHSGLIGVGSGYDGPSAIRMFSGSRFGSSEQWMIHS